jgi:nitronate monooxygenase
MRAPSARLAMTETAVTNVLIGRPARGFYNRAIQDLAPMAADAPEFPSAATALASLRAHAYAISLRCGLGRPSPLARSLALEALAVLKALNG